MDFSEATLMRIKAKDTSDAFTQACKQREDMVKEEIDSLMQVFRGLLDAEGAPVAYAISGGGYMYKKVSSTTVSITKERLGQAVTELSLAQLRKKYKTMCEDKVPTTKQVIQACIQDNLDKACIKTTSKVEVVQRRPKNITESARAPPNADSMAQRYLRLKKQLSDMRKYKAQGRKRCADVADITEPIIQKHMEAVKVQRVRLTPEVSALASPPISLSSSISSSISSSLSGSALEDDSSTRLPELPSLLPHHEIENKMNRTALPTTPTTIIVTGSGEHAERLIEFRKRVYKSRGKSLKPKDFVQGMQRAVSHVPAPSHLTLEEEFGWWLNDGNALLMETLLVEYDTTIETTKTPPTEKLKLKILS